MPSELSYGDDVEGPKLGSCIALLIAPDNHRLGPTLVEQLHIKDVSLTTGDLRGQLSQDVAYVIERLTIARKGVAIGEIASMYEEETAGLIGQGYEGGVLNQRASGSMTFLVPKS